MAKKRSPALDYLVYCAVRLVVAVVQALPERCAVALAGLVAGIAHALDGRHRAVARDNLRRAFPERFAGPPPDADLDRLVWRVYRHFVLMLFEILRLPREIRFDNWPRYVRHNTKALLDQLFSGGPVLFVTGHLGNWEIAGYMLGLYGFRIHAIARTLDNPYLDDYLRRFRETTGQKVLAKKGDYDRITEVLAEGGLLATLGDQDAGPKGMFVDFFGRPASTHKAVAYLALNYRVPMVVCAAVRDGGYLRYHVVVEDVIDPAEYDGRPDAVVAMTRRYTLALERLVRRYPEQYFWLHRRWKHQPAERKAKRAA